MRKEQFDDREGMIIKACNHHLCKVLYVHLTPLIKVFIIWFVFHNNDQFTRGIASSRLLPNCMNNIFAQQVLMQHFLFQVRN